MDGELHQIEKENKNQNIHFLAVHLYGKNDYEDSIVGHIEKKMNVKINNLGVESFSLWQTILY